MKEDSSSGCPCRLHLVGGRLVAATCCETGQATSGGYDGCGCRHCDATACPGVVVSASRPTHLLAVHPCRTPDELVTLLRGLSSAGPRCPAGGGLVADPARHRSGAPLRRRVASGPRHAVVDGRYRLATQRPLGPRGAPAVRSIQAFAGLWAGGRGLGDCPAGPEPGWLCGDAHRRLKLHQWPRESVASASVARRLRRRDRGRRHGGDRQPAIDDTQRSRPQSNSRSARPGFETHRACQDCKCVQ